MFIDSRYLWEANTWGWADDAYIEMEGTYTLIGLTARALPLRYYKVNMRQCYFQKEYILKHHRISQHAHRCLQRSFFGGKDK